LEFCKLLKQESYDLVISDLNMPLVDGIDLTDIIRTVDANLPITIITGYGKKETLKEARQKGAEYFITKPFRKENNLTTIK
jgi:CheY-like chemotaxis protein